MAVPKRKKSKSKVGKRRNHQDLKLPGVSLNSENELREKQKINESQT